MTEPQNDYHRKQHDDLIEITARTDATLAAINKSLSENWKQHEDFRKAMSDFKAGQAVSKTKWAILGAILIAIPAMITLAITLTKISKLAAIFNGP